MKKKIVVLLLSVAVLSLSASATVLVYEPFDYASTTLTGQGGALGTTGVWNSNDWSVHQQGVLSGATVHPDDGLDPVTFDGTVAGLATSGGYAGQDADGGRLSADIALDPAVTASFTSGSTTWLSYVSVVNFTRNYELPNLTLGTIAVPDGSRGDNYGGIDTGGDGIGTGGGPNRDNRNEIYPMFYTTGQYNNVQGPIPSNSYAGNAATFVDDTGAFNAQFDVANIVVVKLEWDAGANGEDIISLARFLEGDVIDEAAFDAQMIAMPNLTSANWDLANQPNLDQLQFDTISFAGIKYFVDEIRLGTEFVDVTPVPEPMTLALLGFGGLAILRRRRA